MAPVVREFAARPATAKSIVCSTGQHREMLEQVLDLFEVNADYELDVMTEGQTLAGLTEALLPSLDSVMEETAPDCVIAQGDTTSVLVAGLLCYYRGIPFAHVEAGLRTGDLSRP